MLKMNDPREAQRYFDHKMAFTTGPVELSHALDQSDIVVIDVRAARDFGEGHVPGAKNLPQDRWDTMSGLNQGKLNVLVCYSQVCHLAASAAQKFTRAGYSVMELEGGFEAWKAHGLPIETGEARIARGRERTQSYPGEASRR